MSRKIFVAGNWKMNTSLAEGVALVEAIKSEMGDETGVDMAVCPPLVYLSAVSKAVAGSSIALGAQNMYFEDNGAFTGETSSAMLKDVGCTYVILGHSERRHVMGEDVALINKKVRKALADGLLPILCVGELLEEREAEKTTDVVTRQIKLGLADVSREDAAKVTIAYEPVWAIGTGVTASPDQAQEVHEMIRGLLAEMYDAELADGLRIQYGGSVKPSNAAELLGKSDIDGALVGGAALKASDFAGIARACL